MQKANARGVSADDALGGLGLPLDLGKPASGLIQLTPKVRGGAVALRSQFLLQHLALLLQLLYLLQHVGIRGVVPQTSRGCQKLLLGLNAMFQLGNLAVSTLGFLLCAVRVQEENTANDQRQPKQGKPPNFKNALQ